MIKRILGLALSLAVRSFDMSSGRVRRWLGRRPVTTGIVLYYHAINPRQRHRFARQMDEVLKHARPFPAGSPEKMSEDEGNVAVTFDDGFRSVVANAVPELEKRGIPFTIFAPSGCLGERPSWIRGPSHPFWEECVISVAELRGLAVAPLATLGSHSVTHSNLVRLDTASAVQELRQSKADLETAAGVKIELFSFPHGAYTMELLDYAREAGYRHVFTIEATAVERQTGVFTVGRVVADPEDWPLEFRLKLAGAYRWQAYFHRLREGLRTNGR